MDKSLFEKYSVLLLEESDIMCELFESWLDGVPTRTAMSVTDLDDEIDSTVAVACLSRRALGDAEEDVRKQLLNRNPYCQLILVLPRDTVFTTPFEDQYDACLTRPLFKDELQTTVEGRLKCGVYSALLREFYQLNTKRHWIRQAENDGKTDSDVDLEAVRTRYLHVRKQLHQLRQEINDDAIYEIVRSLDLHKRYLREPARDAPAIKQSKHHPPRCPQCKLTWGVDHGNELQSGFVRVGAYVWQCAKCENLVHGLGESHRNVTAK